VATLFFWSLLQVFGSAFFSEPQFLTFLEQFFFLLNSHFVLRYTVNYRPGSRFLLLQKQISISIGCVFYDYMINYYLVIYLLSLIQLVTLSCPPPPPPPPHCALTKTSPCYRDITCIPIWRNARECRENICEQQNTVKKRISWRIKKKM
jgi:hypothetical protein